MSSTRLDPDAVGSSYSNDCVLLRVVAPDLLFRHSKGLGGAVAVARCSGTRPTPSCFPRSGATCSSLIVPLNMTLPVYSTLSRMLPVALRGTAHYSNPVSHLSPPILIGY